MTDPCYCILLRKAARKLTASYDEALEPLGITIAQFSLLRNVRRSDGISVTDLADSMVVDRSTAGRNAKVLERAGLIEGSPGEDQRETVLKLTEKGAEVLANAEPIWAERQAVIADRVGAVRIAELNELVRLL